MLPPLQEKLLSTEAELKEHVWLLERGMYLAKFVVNGRAPSPSTGVSG